MLKEVLILTLLTFVPAFELRFSIPVGILSGTVNLPLGYSVSGMGLPWLQVLIICVAANALLGVILYFALDIFVKYFIRYSFFRKPYDFFVRRTQKKVKDSVDKYGFLGISLFIAVPLPGTGTYSAALISHFLGLDKKKFFLANLMGVVLAGIAVTIITFTGKGLFVLIFG